MFGGKVVVPMFIFFIIYFYLKTNKHTPSGSIKVEQIDKWMWYFNLQVRFCSTGLPGWRYACIWPFDLRSRTRWTHLLSFSRSSPTTGEPKRGTVGEFFFVCSCLSWRSCWMESWLLQIEGAKILLAILRKPTVIGLKFSVIYLWQIILLKSVVL